MDPSHPTADPGTESPAAPLGPALRRAWVGYQRQLDQAMADRGFADRRFPDGRVLRICRRSPGTTTAQIGRELGISRQGAAAIVGELRELGYVEVTPSSTSGREKAVVLTDRGHDYLAAHRRATRALDARLRRALGVDGFDHLHRLLELLGQDDDPRLRGYLRNQTSRRGPNPAA